MKKLKASITFKISIMCTSLLLGGCSIIDTIISDSDSKLVANERVYKKSVSCKATSTSYSIAGHSSESNRQFQSFLISLEEKKIYTSFVEKAAMWSLIQMAVRPDMASPTARFTYGLRQDSNFKYRDYQDALSNESEEHDSYPFLYGIKKMLLESKAKRSLNTLANILDRHFPSGVNVGLELQHFIDTNKKELKSYPKLRRFFFRGKQGLRSSETLKRASFRKIVNLLKGVKADSKNYQTDRTLFPFSSQKYSSKINCNYDLNLYDHNVFLKTPTIVQSVPFMLSQGDKLFVASASQDISSPYPLAIPPLIGGDSKRGLRSAICNLKLDTGSIDMISTKDRDPAQVLYDLLTRSNITFSKSALQDAMEMGRTLYFLNPYRAIVESNIASSEQMDNLSKNRTPIYHHYPIGNVFMGLFSSKKKVTTPILDLRGENQLLCK